MNVVCVPAKWRTSSGRAGPSPTNARCAPGPAASSHSRSAARFFSARRQGGRSRQTEININ